MSNPTHPFGNVIRWLKIEVTDTGMILVHGKIGNKPFETVAHFDKAPEILRIVGDVVFGTYRDPEAIFIPPKQ